MGGESPLRHGKVTCDAAVLYDFTGPGQLDALVPWLEEECHTQVYANGLETAQAVAPFSTCSYFSIYRVIGVGWGC